MRTRTLIVTIVVALAAAACGGGGSAPDEVAQPEPTAPAEATGDTAPTEATDQVELTQDSPACPTEGEEFEVAKLYIEHNATDADTGVHGLFGGEAWTDLCLLAPDGTQILAVDPLEQFDDLAIADFFFESREPPNDEVSVDEILAEFPEGEYTVAGVDFEGVPRVGAATFTHDIPVEPTILWPELVEDPDEAEEVAISTSDLVVSWEPVTETLAGDPLTVTAYEVIVTMEDYDDPNGLSHPIYDVHVGPDATSLGVPSEFFEPDTVYELEVLVLEESGNQTIGLGFFMTATAGGDEEALEWEDGAEAFIELNATSGDVGFHSEFGGEPWAAATIVDVDGNEIFRASNGGSLRAQGLAGVMFESAEPDFDELSLEDFLARFPAGEYMLLGETIEGEAVASPMEFSHLIPDAPSLLAPAEDAVVDAEEGLTISWEPVTGPDGVEVEVYSVQLYPVDPPEGEDPIELNIDYTLEVPASVTEVAIPPEILMAGAEYELELMVVDAGGNRTFAVGTFATSG